MSDRVDISATIKVNDQASAGISRMRSAIEGVQATAQKAAQSLKNFGSVQNIGNAFKGLGSSIGRLGSMVMSVVKPVLALVGIGGGIGMAEAVAGMENYVKSVKELSRMAPVIGTTVERLSGLQYAASRVGIDADQMNNALIRANAAMAKAATGKGNDLTKLFNRMKISLRDGSGQMRTSVDVLEDFARAIARQTDPVLKLRMATELFGRAAGPEMLKLLDQGAEGIQKFVKEAQDLNLVIGPEEEQKALEFAKAQGEVRKVWMSLSMTLSQNLLPILKDVVVLFGNLLKENKDDIVKGLTAAFQALADVLKGIKWRDTIDDIKAWGGTIKWFVDLIGGWKVAFAAIAAVMAGPLVSALAAVALAFLKLSAALLANPVIAIITAIAVAAYLIWKYWEPIKKFFIDLWEQVRGAFDAVVEWLGPWGNLFVPLAIYKNWDAIVAFFTELWPKVKEVFWAAVNWLEPFAQLWIPYAIYKNWDKLREFFLPLWEDVKAVFWAAIDWLGEFFSAWTPQINRAAWDAIVSFIRGILEGVSSAFERAWKIIEPIYEALKKAIGFITDNMPSLSGIGEKLKGAGSAVWNAPGNLLDYGRRSLGLGGDSGGSVVNRSIVQQSAQQQQPPARVDGEVGVNIHLSGQTEGVTMATRQRGQVHATGDVGQSMPALS